MSNKNRYDRQLDGFLDEIDRSMFDASDQEVIDDARHAGVDLRANADNLRQRFLTAARTFQKRNFAQAERDYAAKAKTLQERTFRIPESAAEQRALLQLVIAQQTQKGLAMTAKFRDFESMPDSDLPGLLEELDALGLLLKSEDK